MRAVAEFDEEDLASLVTALNEGELESPSAYKKAIRALVIHGVESATATIIKHLVAPESPESVKVTAAHGLGQMRSGEALNALRDALGDDSASVRKFAVKSIGRYGDVRAGELLMSAAQSDQEDFVREIAAEVLAERR